MYKTDVVLDVMEELKTDLDYSGYQYDEFYRVVVAVEFNPTDEQVGRIEPSFWVTDIDNAISLYLRGETKLRYYPIDEVKEVIRHEVERRVDMGFTRRGV